ncbi:MAG: hypothetical protein K6E34_06880 [Lachnospiraceae bacterium]|nr:hypothetical protein [Lachnospiraceae bacterium]
MLSIEIYRKIYNLLDKVNPLSYDCGKSCGAVCCRNDSFADDAEPYIYLLPGENKYLEAAGADIEIRRELRKKHNLPESYGDHVYTAVCKGPENCDRRFRPIQCRSFPLWPYFTDNDELILTYYDDELPYVCPLIYDRQKLSDDFIRATYEAWDILSGDESVKDLIRLYSSVPLRP